MANNDQRIVPVGLLRSKIEQIESVACDPEGNVCIAGADEMMQRTPLDMFFGMKVVCSPAIGPVPKIQLSHDFNACSREFKREFNAWLLKRFGTEQRAYILLGGVLAVDPRTMGMIRNLAP